MLKKISIIIFSLILLSLVIMIISGYSVTICPQVLAAKKYNYQDGDIVNPFEDFDFGTGEWSAFVIFSTADRSTLQKGLGDSTVIHCDDKSVLLELKEQVSFIYTDSDLSTVTSRLLIFQDHVLMFDSGIVVDANLEGLQSQDFGWLECTEKKKLYSILSKFKRVWSPLVYLN